MSLTKSSPSYAMHMDEVMREEVDNTDQLHAEFLYLQSKQTSPTGHKQQNDERFENDKQA